MAAVSANVIHHQQNNNHVKVQEEQSDEESNDGSLHSIAREKADEVSSPEYKPPSPDVTTANPFLPPDPMEFSASPERTAFQTPPKQDQNTPSPDKKLQQSPLQNSPFSMHNVLKMKSERDSVSPPVCSNAGVFSTEKLLENTPNYVRRLSSHIEESPRETFSGGARGRSYDRSPKRSGNETAYRESSEYEVRNSSPAEDEEKSSSHHGALDSSRMEDMEDVHSCCSDDTVLSVGNEAQIGSFDSENRTSSTANSQVISPRSSPAPSPASVPSHMQNLSSFKHIQSHLSAISQLSQNLHGGQHLLLRPNPIAPNPLLFLNQNRLLFNPHHPLQPSVPQLDMAHQNHHSLSNSPTSINPAMSRLSPNEISPNPSLNTNQMSPPSPGCDGKLNLMQNLTNFAVLGQQVPPSLRFYKQNPFASPGVLPMSQNMPGLTSGFGLTPKSSHEEGSRKGLHKSGHHEKMNPSNGSVGLMNQGSVNERLFGGSNALNSQNITNHHLNAEDERHLILNHNGLKFSIDNILKADFGRRITDPLHKRKSSSSHSKHKFGAAVLNPLGPGSANSLQPSKHHQVPLHHLKEASFGSKSGAFHSAKELNTNSFYSQKSSNSVPSGNSASRLSSERLSAEARIPPADLKTGASLQNNLVTSSNNGGSAAVEKVPGGASTPIDLSKQEEEAKSKSDPMVWPAWVYCTRYSDRPSSGRSPRTRRPKKAPGDRSPGTTQREEEKRPRTAFSGPQLARLKHEFAENRYLTERRRQQLSAELGLNEAQIKIWFQNKRAKIKKASGQKNPLALQLMAQGLYNHSTVPLSREEEELQELHAREAREA